jgi:hypothetical protein
MVDLVPRALSELPEVVFEPERFELKDGRIELSGRWYGAEGRRFIRPSLIFPRGDGETRLLADLEHKPWAAESGEPWHAAFPCDDDLDPGANVELAVAPDLTIELAVPAGLGADSDAPNRGVRPRVEAEPENGAEPPMVPESASVAESVAAAWLSDASADGDDEGRSLQATAMPVRDRAPEAAAETDDTAETDDGSGARALSAARGEIATLNERAEELTVELKRERSRFTRELGQAHEAAAEALRGRDEAVAQRQKAIEARQIAEQTIEQALAARGKAKRAGERAVEERDAAAARLHEALTQREEAVARLNEALAERDHALAQRDEARAERDRAVSDLKRVSSERDELAAASERPGTNYERALTMPRTSIVTRSGAIESPAQWRRAHWLAVAIPVVALLVVILAVALILGLN